MTEYDKPLPMTTPEAEPYWEAAREERLILQNCDKCGSTIFHPRYICPYCYSRELSWIDASGRGELYSYSTQYYGATDEWDEDVPYTVGIVHLEEDVYMFTNIVNYTSDELVVGTPVQVVFDHVTEEVTLPKFEPV